MLKDLVIIVVGATGTGKSQLAIDLALQYGGEIINADSMQVYKDLPIATNKVAQQEMDLVKHHLMNIKEYNEPFSLYEFIQTCIQTVKSVIANGKVPIIVGGTNLYLFHLIFGFKEKPQGYEERFHENDKRRRHRQPCNTSLLSSECLSSLGVSTKILIIDRKIENLDEYLNERFDKMVQLGLVQEVTSFYDKICDPITAKAATISSRTDIEAPGVQSTGIFQAIGFKEFHNYYLHRNEECLKEALDKVKTNTRRYSRQQRQWIRNKLIPECHRHVLNVSYCSIVYEDLSEWNVNVLNVAKEFVENTVDPKPLECPPNLRNWNQYACEWCQRKFIGSTEWKTHLKTRRHWKRVKTVKNSENKM